MTSVPSFWKGAGVLKFLCKRLEKREARLSLIRAIWLVMIFLSNATDKSHFMHNLKDSLSRDLLSFFGKYHPDLSVSTSVVVPREYL